MSRFERWLVFIILFTIPANLFLKLNPEAGYVHGLFVDYLIAKVYLLDLLLLLLLGAWLLRISQIPREKLLEKIQGSLSQLRNQPILVTAFFLTGLVVVRQFFTQEPLVALGQSAKWLEVFIFGCYLWNNHFSLSEKWSRAAVLLAVGLQSSLAIYQFIFQRSLAGFWLLGEPDLSRYLGIARASFSGEELLLPYGTTAHPNILAGFLVLSSLLIVREILKNKEKTNTWLVLQLGGLFLAAIAIWMTHSWTAWMALGIGLGTLVNHPKFRQALLIISLGFFLLMPILITQLSAYFPDQPSLTRRLYLNQAAINIWAQNPFFGTGLHHFTLQLEKVTPRPEVVAFIQPAHHLGLLAVSEAGWLGIGLTGIALLLILKNSALKRSVVFLAPVFILGSLDHYLFTVPTGMFSLMLFCVVMLREPE